MIQFYLTYVICILILYTYRFTDKVHRENDTYSVSFMFNRVTLRAEHQAIRLLRNHNAIRLLFKSRVPSKNVKKSEE